MSRYDWERGTLKLSGAEFRRVRRAFIEEMNRGLSQDLAQIERLLGVLKANAKGKRGFKWKEEFERLLDEVRSVGWNTSDYVVPLVVMPRHDVTWRMFTEPKDEKVNGYEYRSRVPVDRPKRVKKSEVMIAKAAEWIHGDGCMVRFDTKQRTILWSVEENNHAVEHARSSAAGKILFKLLAGVKWTRGTGGVMVGNDEYNADGGRECAGGGGSYITARFGPLGEKEYERHTGFKTRRRSTAGAVRPR